MGFDYRRLRAGEIAAGVCAVLLFFDMFIQWYDVQGFGQAKALGVDIPTITAWRAFDFVDLLLFAVILATLALVVLSATERTPALPIAASVIVTVLGAIAVLVILFRLVDQPGPNNIITVSYGAYLGFLLSLGITVGGYFAMAEEGTSFTQARAQAENMMRERGINTGPPAMGSAGGAGAHSSGGTAVGHEHEEADPGPTLPGAQGRGPGGAGAGAAPGGAGPSGGTPGMTSGDPSRRRPEAGAGPEEPAAGGPPPAGR